MGYKQSNKSSTQRFNNAEMNIVNYGSLAVSIVVCPFLLVSFSKILNLDSGSPSRIFWPLFILFIPPLVIRWVIRRVVGLLSNRMRNNVEPLPKVVNLKSKATTPHYIIKAPGTKLLALVDFLFPPTTVEQTFKPLVADWRFEYFEALKQGRLKKARWISMRYRISFINAMSLSKVFSFLKQFRSASK